MPRHPPKQLTQLERDFERHLTEQGRAALTISQYGSTVRRFMGYFESEPLHRLTDERVKCFFREQFGHRKKSTQIQASAIVREFLQFAAERLSVPVVINGRESKAAPVLDPVKDAKEIALRDHWSFDRLLLEKERGDDLIALLGRQLVNHYLFFQSRLTGTPENLDDII